MKMENKHWMVFRIILYFIGLSFIIIDCDMWGKMFIKFLGSVVLAISIFVTSLKD